MARMTATQHEQKVRAPYFGAVYFGGFAAITLMGFVVLAVAVIASIRAGYGTAHTT